VNNEDVEIKDEKLLADTTKHAKRVWHRCLFLNPAKIGLKKNSVYSVEFDYEILKSPSYFQLMERGPKWRLLLNWSGPDGFKSHAVAIFRTDPKRPRELMFGMKNPGAIVLDNIIIRRWDSEKDAEKGMKALKVDVDFIRRKTISLKQTLSISESHNFEIGEIISAIEKLMEKGSLNVDEKLELDRLSNKLDLRVFKKNVSEKVRLRNSKFAVLVENSISKVRRDAPCRICDEPDEVTLSAARNEFESFQLLVAPLMNLKGFRIELNDLKKDDGTRLSARNFSFKKVEYVDTGKKLYPVAYSGWWPDPLVEFERCSISDSLYLQPFWVTLQVPSDAAAGHYSGILSLICEGSRPVKVPISVNVRNFTLPNRPSFRTAFGVGGSAAYYKKLGVIGDDPKLYLKINNMYRDSLLRYKLSPTKIAPPPPFADGYVKTLIKTASGEYKADTSNFDANLTHCLSEGLNGFSFGTYWGWRNHQKGVRQKILILNEREEVIERLNPKFGDSTFDSMLGAYFKSWETHLKKRSCLDMAYYYIYDEPAPDERRKVNKLLSLIKANAPGIKTIIPGVPAKGDGDASFPGLGIMCPLLSRMDVDLARRLQKEKGKESWWYVCMTPRHPYPNLFIDYPAVDHRILFWMAWKYNVTGMLYWQTTFWSRANPWEDPETYPTTHGDGCLFYPSRSTPVKVVPSIRLEVLRDGVEDYEYLHLLKRLLNGDGGKRISQALRDEAEKLLIVPRTVVETRNSYCSNPKRILAERERIGDMIEKLLCCKDEKNEKTN
jgi:hypothetical protein